MSVPSVSDLMRFYTCAVSEFNVFWRFSVDEKLLENAHVDGERFKTKLRFQMYPD